MSSNFPTSQPGAKTNFDSNTAVASSLQNAQGEDINAVAAKVGSGAANNAPASGKLLRGTGVGTSQWDKDAPTGTIVGTSDTQTLTNKTLTGVTLTAGSTTVAPLKFLSGTNLTTPVAGVIEFDGTDFYLTI